jgi:hypothetical protein
VNTDDEPPRRSETRGYTQQSDSSRNVELIEADERRNRHSKSHEEEVSKDNGNGYRADNLK